ncbi:MAG: class I SAM-dependent methyltransferase [Desulfomonile tiedjei]|nr:class I SAM-dependent methyltransferase [Desulfomonile tiedjei]
MILNRFEFLAMNNPLRSLIQRRFEARRFLRMGGSAAAGHALEIGCGRGVGAEIIFDEFSATTVDAFDLDPKMVELAGKRLKSRGDKLRLWVGDASAIEAPDSAYDTVFDFGIIHHIPDWRKAIAEVFRVLKPGGRFYAEEVLRAFIFHPLWRRLLDHPTSDRFDHIEFMSSLRQAGFAVTADKSLWNAFGWYIADKPTLSAVHRQPDA